MSKEYEIEVSNGMKISFEDSGTYLMLHITFPTSNKRVTLSRPKSVSVSTPRKPVDSDSLRVKAEPSRPRDGGLPNRIMQSITDSGSGGSGLMLTFGDPEDPNMP